MPTGAGKEPWAAMGKFLDCHLSQVNLQHKAEGKANHPSTEAVESLQTASKKARKVFDKAELASLDTVFKASKGHPGHKTIERLADSLQMEKSQVGFFD